MINKLENGLFNIELDGTIVGGGSMTTDDFLYLERIDIDGEYRNKGIGTKALEELQHVYGGYVVVPDSEDSARLYERLFNKISNADYDAWGFAIDLGYGVYRS